MIEKFNNPVISGRHAWERCTISLRDAMPTPIDFTQARSRLRFPYVSEIKTYYWSADFNPIFGCRAPPIRSTALRGQKRPEAQNSLTRRMRQGIVEADSQR